MIFQVGGGGCEDDRQARLEFFLDPLNASKPASLELLDPLALGENPEMADRINQLPYQEVVQRVGAHRYGAKVGFEFNTDGERTALNEEDTVIIAQNGDFRAKAQNSANQGFEILFSGKRVFVRDLFGQFHEHNPVHSDLVKFRDMACGAWASIYRLYRGRLSFTKQQMVMHHGRKAIQYSLSLSSSAPRLAGTKETPAPPAGVTKYVYPIQPTPSDNDRYRDRAVPIQALGTLLVDTDSAAIVKVDFSGKFNIPAASPSNASASLQLTARIEMDGFGNPPSISPPDPKNVEELPEQITVDTHPIDFYFGKGYTATRGAAAGVAAGKSVNSTQKSAGTTQGGTP